MTKETHGAVRVTMIGSLPPQRGVSPYVFDLSQALAARSDLNLDVVAFRDLYPRWLYPGGDPEDGSLPVEVDGAATRRPLRWWNPFGWLLAGLTLRGDIVHAQWWSYPLAPVYIVLLACARLRRKAVVLTIHNAAPHEGGTFRRLANRAVLPFAHRLIVHTNENARVLRTMCRPSQPIDVIPMGARAVGEALAEARAARERVGVPLDAPTVLFFGNIRPYKGVPVLLRAFRAVHDALPAARLILAGETWGAGAEEINREIARLGLADLVVAHLRYLPETDVAGYFAAADVVAFPYTHFDAQSAAACVALTYGKAIVVTDTGGLPDLAAADAVVPANDTAQLAAVLLRVLREPSWRAELEAHSRETAARMSWPAVAAATAGLYLRLAHAATMSLARELEPGGGAST